MNFPFRRLVRRNLFLALGLGIVGSLPLYSLTSEELAQFLNIHSWESRVDLASGKFRVEIFQVTNGEISGRLVAGDSYLETNPSRRLLIMIGAGDVPGTVKGSLTLGGYGVGGQERGPLDDPKSGFGSTSLPKALKPGDYVLGGGYRIEDGHTVVSNRISDLKCGFLLRVTPLGK